MWCESMMKGNKSALIHYQFLLLWFVCFAVSYTVFPGIPYPGLFQQCTLLLLGQASSTMAVI